jgi:hypothetical protein
MRSNSEPGHITKITKGTKNAKELGVRNIFKLITLRILFFFGFVTNLPKYLLALGLYQIRIFELFFKYSFDDWLT